MTKSHFWLISPFYYKVKLADFCLWVFEFENLCGGSTHEYAALVQKEEEEEQIDTQEKTKTMKKKVKQTQTD